MTLYMMSIHEFQEFELRIEINFQCINATYTYLLVVNNCEDHSLRIHFNLQF